MPQPDTRGPGPWTLIIAPLGLLTRVGRAWHRRRMPGPKAIITVKRPTSREAIQGLIDAVARAQGDDRPDELLARRVGKTVYAVRQWLARGVPMRYWDLLAELAGVPREAVARAHRVRRVTRGEANRS